MPCLFKAGFLRETSLLAEFLCCPVQSFKRKGVLAGLDLGIGKHFLHVGVDASRDISGSVALRL
jgi:hypothetical protein